jgi:broad specificity phosphatase PhoE
MAEPVVITPAAIFFVHHGETEWNRAGRYQGRLDSPLTAEGRAQAARVAALLAREVRQIRGVRLVTSPLGRAVATARIIGAALGLAFATDARLVELSLGAWEGMTRDEIAATAPGALSGASRWDWYFRAPDGESFGACAERLAAFLAECREPAILVGHGVAGRILRGLYAGVTRDEALRQKVSRDGVFKLAAGRITFLDGTERP